jgi:glutaredoxin
LLLTWVSDEGDFHVVESIGLVPEGRRKQVRVVVTDQASGTGATVYVADLTAKQSDGTYPVATLPRAEWEKLGADRRKTRLEALAPGQPAPDPATASPQPADSNGTGVGDQGPAHLGGGISAIVYGAEWCKPCHDAERYLKSLGVSVTKKDIEESRAAQAEMQQKLVRVNRAGAGIPVIDVMGKIFVGFSPGSLKQAVDAAIKSAASPKRG